MMDAIILMQGPVLLSGSLDFFRRNLNQILDVISGERIQIIVSTWSMDLETERSLENEFKSVWFCFNEDPGALIHEIKETSIVCNVNRLIVSVFNGLQTVPDDAVVLKIRTDSFIYNLDAFQRFHETRKIKQIRNEKYSVFSHFVLCASLFIRNPSSHIPMLYHPGDICFIGYCADLKKMFDIDLATNNIFKSSGSINIRTEYALVPEQYVFLTMLRKNISLENHPIVFNENFNFLKSEIDTSNQYLINNFIFMSCFELGFSWPKYKKKYFNKGWSSIYDYNDWKSLQNRYNMTAFKVQRVRVFLKKVMIVFAKGYYPIRNLLLQNKTVYKIAYKLFANR